MKVIVSYTILFEWTSVKSKVGVTGLATLNNFFTRKIRQTMHNNTLS